MKLHRVTLSGDTQHRRVDCQPSHGQAIPTALLKFLVVDAFVHEMAVHCSAIFRPLVFDVDQCPLAAAEGEVLQARKLEVVVLLIVHPMRVQVTPAGRADSSTVTV